MSAGRRLPVHTSGDAVRRKCVFNGPLRPLPVPRKQAILRVSAMTTLSWIYIGIFQMYNEHSLLS